MVQTIFARNVYGALIQGYALLQSHGIREDSRNGPVLRYPEPVATVYERPWERVLFDAERDANPFFHIVEAAWMLAGRDTLKDLTPYVKRMASYSDDGGKTQPGAYGYRWRNWFKGPPGGETGDQIVWAIKRLRANTQDRRVVIAMWDGEVDPHAADAGSADVPCNLTVLPWVSGGKLHITVTCRSNDMVMGAYGANAIHFSMLQEYLAGQIGLPMGTYTQFSNNFHMYINDAGVDLETWKPERDPYTEEEIFPYPLAGPWPGAGGPMPNDRIIMEDLGIFFDKGAFVAATKARWTWLRRVLCPMALAHEHYRVTKGEDRYIGALDILDRCDASDWRRAGREWIVRRHIKWQRAQDDGATQ